MENCWCRDSSRKEIIDYLKRVTKDIYGVYALFYGPGPFNTLFSEGGLIEGNLIRRQHARGGGDDVYSVTSDGKLKGLTDIDMYPGYDGVFNPEELLSEEKNPDGWILSPVILPQVIRRLDSK